MEIKVGNFTVKSGGLGLEVFDVHGNMIHSLDSDEFEEWYEYDSNNNDIYYRNSEGFVRWYEYNYNDDTAYSIDSWGFEKWYDNVHNITHLKCKDGDESWYNSAGDEITKEEFDKIYA